MDISPSDLGMDWGVAIIQGRAMTWGPSHATYRGRLRHALASSARPRFGPFGRFWTEGTGLSDAARAEVMKSMGHVIGGSIGGFVGGSSGLIAPTIALFVNNQPLWGALLGTLWLGMASMGMLMPKIVLQRWARNPVNAAEVEALLDNREDGLERAYLTLIRDAVKQNLSDQAATEVRKAIRALGEAIERLPPLTTSGEVDADQLRAEAVHVQEQAAQETDTVTAASLLRQAEALRRSALAAERASVVLRRNAALRKELAAQTEALRLGLASLYAGAGDMSELTRLAEQVRGVASEANAVSDARTELDSFLATHPVQEATVGADRAVSSVVNPVAAPQVQISLRK